MRRTVWTILLVSLVTTVGCSAAEDFLRAARNSGDELARAKSHADEIARTLRSADESLASASARVEAIPLEFQVPEELRQAFSDLLWDVGCDIVGGRVEATPESVRDELAFRVATFGLQFFGDVAALIGEALLVDAGFGRSADASEACARLSNSGI